MKKSLCFLGNCFTYLLAVVQTNEIFELVSFILSILISILILIEKVISWYKKSKKDGKIDESEIKEGLDILIDGTKDIKNNIDKKGEK